MTDLVPPSLRDLKTYTTGRKRIRYRKFYIAGSVAGRVVSGYVPRGEVVSSKSTTSTGGIGLVEDVPVGVAGVIADWRAYLVLVVDMWCSSGGSATIDDIAVYIRVKSGPPYMENIAHHSVNINVTEVKKRYTIVIQPILYYVTMQLIPSPHVGIRLRVANISGTFYVDLLDYTYFYLGVIE